jgi:hypothetical protein
MLTKENRSTSISTINLKQMGLMFIQSLRSENPATNCPSHGKAMTPCNLVDNSH